MAIILPARAQTPSPSGDNQTLSSPEYKNALRSAQSYVRVLDMSEAGLYDQLTSEYGGKFPKKAAKYALKHVKVNYKREALGAAQS